MSHCLLSNCECISIASQSLAGTDSCGKVLDKKSNDRLSKKNKKDWKTNLDSSPMSPFFTAKDKNSPNYPRIADFLKQRMIGLQCGLQ